MGQSCNPLPQNSVQNFRVPVFRQDLALTWKEDWEAALLTQLEEKLLTLLILEATMPGTEVFITELIMRKLAP